MPSNYDALRKQVEADGGLYTTTMEELREIHGAGRLGKHVRDAISSSLSSNGMGHFPEELPSYQGEPVRVYRLGSTIADTVAAVLNPTEQGDLILRQTGGSPGQDILRQIRELVCE